MTAEDEEFERIQKRIDQYKKNPRWREWVGLTEEEIKECFVITPDQFLPLQIYKRIEAKLKDKNT
jgi:hypothetical protein